MDAVAFGPKSNILCVQAFLAAHSQSWLLGHSGSSWVSLVHTNNAYWIFTENTSMIAKCFLLDSSLLLGLFQQETKIKVKKKELQQVCSL